MTQNFWKWPETKWISDDISWQNGEKIVAGIDIGTTSSQAVILVDEKLYAYNNIRTGINFKETADFVLNSLLDECEMTIDDINTICATGFGSENVNYATRTVDEIQCQMKGARYMFGPSVHTVVDLGGQTTKALRLYDWDRVRDFTLNDKCATGFGRNLEWIANLLQVPITELGEKSLDVQNDPEPVSTTCYSFADPETLGLFRPAFREEPLSENEVIASHLFTVAWRALSTIGKLLPLDIGDMKVYEDIAFTGGLAKNIGIISRIERELNAKALDTDYDPQLAGAIGAALLA